MFQASSRKEYVNPYRHGVYIGNFVEDIIAMDLVEKHKQTLPDINRYKSETREKFCDPGILENKNIKHESNRKPNFDLNIDFNKKTMQEINDQIKQNIVNNNNRANLIEKSNNKKTIFEKEKDNKVEDFLCNTQRNNILSNYSNYSVDVQNHIGKQTDGFIRKDLVGLYFTTRSGLSNNILRGHGAYQNNWSKTEHISVKEYIFNLVLQLIRKLELIIYWILTIQLKINFPSQKNFKNLKQ